MQTESSSSYAPYFFLGILLIFAQTGLFAATVATFFVDSYKTMQPDPAAATVVLLAHLSQQISTIGNGSAVLPSTLPVDPSIFDPTPSKSSTRVNVLWSLSLVLSLICALMATLVQQWSRRYLGRTKHRLSPAKRARLRAHLVKGVETFRMTAFVNAIPALLHMSVLLFLAGFIEYQLLINRVVAFTVLTLALACTVVYVALSISPFVRSISPYQTPLSNPLRIASALQLSLCFRLFSAVDPWLRPYSPWASGRSTGIGSRALRRCYNFVHAMTEWSHGQRRRFHEQARLDLDLSRSSARDGDALQWVVGSLDDDAEFEPLVDGLPGYIDHNPGRTLEFLKEVSSKTLLVDRIFLLAGTCKDNSGTYMPSKRFRSCAKALLWCADMNISPVYEQEWSLVVVAGNDLAAVWQRLSPLLVSADAQIPRYALAGITFAAQNRAEDASSTESLEFIVSCMQPPLRLTGRIRVAARHDRHLLSVVNFISYLSRIDRCEVMPVFLVPSDMTWSSISTLWKRLPSTGHGMLDLSEDARVVAFELVEDVLESFGGHQPVISTNPWPVARIVWYHTLLVILRAVRSRLSDSQTSSIDPSPHAIINLFSEQEAQDIDSDFLVELGIS